MSVLFHNQLYPTKDLRNLFTFYFILSPNYHIFNDVNYVNNNILRDYVFRKILLFIILYSPIAIK